MMDIARIFMDVPPEGKLLCDMNTIADWLAGELESRARRLGKAKRVNRRDLQKCAALILRILTNGGRKLHVSPRWTSEKRMSPDELCLYLDTVCRKGGEGRMRAELAWTLHETACEAAIVLENLASKQVFHGETKGIHPYVIGQTLYLAPIPNPDHVRQTGRLSDWNIFPRCDFGKYFPRIPRRPEPLRQLDNIIACLESRECPIPDSPCVMEIRKFTGTEGLRESDRNVIFDFCLEAIIAMRSWLKNHPACLTLS